MRSFLNALKLFIWLTLLTGAAYPLFITLIAQTTMKQKADGSIIYDKGIPRGSELIAQKFEDNRYFWPRPSAINYNPMPSSASNLSPTSKELKDIVEARKQTLARAHAGSFDNYPSELLFASGSGVDPHLSPEALYFQIDRIVKARNVDPQKIDIKHLIDTMIIHEPLGFLGTTHVNVLLLNIALDKLVAD